MIPITIPFMGEEESAATREVIQSGWVTQGPKVAEFEQAVADYCGAKHAVAISNCTAGLHLTMLACGVSCGTEVICPSLSFIATANAIRHCGAQPVFVEVDKASYNLDPQHLASAITEKTSAILVVHQMGLPANLDEICDIAAARGVVVIEDGACAIGSRYRDQPIGSAQQSKAVCFSFHPRKVLSTGEGGMITTNDQELADRLRILRHQGMSVSDLDRHQSRRVVIEQYAELGYNFRLTDVQAAIGVEQMKKLDWIVQRRRELAENYNESLASHKWLRPPRVEEFQFHNYQSYCISLSEDAPLQRNEVMQAMLDAGIATRRGIMLCHREPVYSYLGITDADLPQSVAASDHSLILPLFPQMTEGQQATVVKKLFAL